MFPIPFWSHERFFKYVRVICDRQVRVHKLRHLKYLRGHPRRADGAFGAVPPARRTPGGRVGGALSWRGVKPGGPGTANGANASSARPVRSVRTCDGARSRRVARPPRRFANDRRGTERNPMAERTREGRSVTDGRGAVAMTVMPDTWIARWPRKRG